MINLPRRVFFVSIASIFLSFILTAQFSSRTSWLKGEIEAFEKVQTNAAKDIEECNQKLKSSDAMIAKCEGFIARAREKRDAATEQVSRRALANEREVNKKLVAMRNAALSREAWARNSAARIRELVSAQGESNVQGLVFSYNGQVSYFSQRLNKQLSLDEGEFAALEVGDFIVTGEASSLELHCLDGMGSVHLEENTRLVIRERDLNWLLEMKYGAIRAGLKRRLERRLNVRTPSCVTSSRGTQFHVSADSTGTECIVLEDSVWVTNLKNKSSSAATIVGEGYRVFISKDGTISAPEKIDLKNFERRWNNEQ